MVQFAMGFAFGRPTETGRRSMQSQIECQALIRMVSSLFTQDPDLCLHLVTWSTPPTGLALKCSHSMKQSWKNSLVKYQKWSWWSSSIDGDRGTSNTSYSLVILYMSALVLVLRWRYSTSLLPRGFSLRRTADEAVCCCLRSSDSLRAVVVSLVLSLCMQ